MKCLEFSKNLGTGEIKISCPADFGERYLSPLVADFMSAPPSVAIRLDLGNDKHSLIDSPYDIVLRGYQRFPDQAIREHNVTMRVIAHRQMSLFASREYADRKGLPESVDELCGHDCIVFQPAEQVASSEQQSSLARSGFPTGRPSGWPGKRRAYQPRPAL